MIHVNFLIYTLNYIMDEDRSKRRSDFVPLDVKKKTLADKT